MGRPRKVVDDEEEATASFSVPEPDGNNLTPFERETLARQKEERRQFEITERKRKDQDARIDRDLAEARGVLSNKVRKLLVEHYADDPAAEDTVNRMMRDIDPILAAGKDGKRRERGRMFLVPPKPVPA